MSHGTNYRSMAPVSGEFHWNVGSKEVKPLNEVKRVNFDRVTFERFGGKWFVEKTNTTNKIASPLGDGLFGKFVNEIMMYDERVVAVLDFPTKIEIWAYSPFDHDMYDLIPRKMFAIIDAHHDERSVHREDEHHIAILMIIPHYEKKSVVKVAFHVKFLVDHKDAKSQLTPYIRCMPFDSTHTRTKTPSPRDHRVVPGKA
jgi:hypothetical protein